MKFERAAFHVRHLWSSPFVRWQGSLADVSAIDLGVAVTRDAMAQRDIDPASVTQLVFGATVPQPGQFYAAPWIAARLGLPAVTGPQIAQACATSVACLAAAAACVECDRDARTLVVTADRTSNGPLLVHPRPAAPGGSPATELWVLDNFAADPWTSESMLATAEAVAGEGGFSREALDETTLLRYRQYERALEDDRAFQRAVLQPVVLDRGRARLVVERDEGIHATTAEGLRKLKPVREGGVVTYGTQTHPADGTAGAFVVDVASAKAGDGVVRLLAAGFARAEKARMPKAAATAAQRAMRDAGLSFADVKVVTTHNPFAVNDLWFARETGFPLDRMNPYGCSLVYGHPQGPTGLRAIAELVEALRRDGGGIGLFTGCAAGDTGAALVVRVDV